MHLFSLMCVILIFSQSITYATSSSDKSKEMGLSSKQKILPFLNEDRFAIYYVFDETLNSALKETLIKNLKRIGTVCLSDESTLSETQKQDRCRPGGMIINISATQVAENTSSGYQNLPVIEIQMKVISGAQIPQNGSQLTAIIWEKEQFIGMIKEKEKLIQKAIKATSTLLDMFIQEYQSANPQIENQKPQFFFYY